MKKYLFSVTVIVGIALCVFPQVTFAHERDLFQIGDTDYLWVIGSLNEPIFIDDKTGVDLRIKIADPADPTNSQSLNAVPVEGLEQNLQVEVTAGGKKKIFPLEPAFRDPGAYRAPFYPTVATTFSYRIFGTFNNVPVDLLFTCNPVEGGETAEETDAVQVSDGVTRKYKAGSFGCPRSKSEVTFPESVSGMRDLSASIEDREPVSTATHPDKTSIAISLAALVLSALAVMRRRNS